MADADIKNEKTPLLPKTATNVASIDEEVEIEVAAPSDEQDDRVTPKDNVEESPSLPTVSGKPGPEVAPAFSSAFDPEAVGESAKILQRAILPKTMQVLPWRTFFILSFAVALS